MSERSTQADILLRCSIGDTRLFRNNVGQAWMPSRGGEVIKTRYKGQEGVIITNPIPVRYGLHVGSGDLIGWRSITITPDMVGQRGAGVCSLEVKSSTGRATDEQLNWERQVNEAGGRAGIARNVAEAGLVLDGA